MATPRWPALIVLMIATTTRSVTSAADWSNWGGVRADGVSAETGLMSTWPEGGPRVLWRKSLGQGYSSFAVVNGRAYTQYQDLWGQYLVCLDAATGDTVWSHRYEVPYETAGIYPGPRSTPAVFEGRVYGVSPDAVLFCCDAATGKPLWDVKTHSRFRGEGTEFGYSASPRVIDGKVLLPIGGRNAAVVAFDARTGDVVWQAGDEPASYCTLQTLTLAGTDYVLAYLQNGILLCRLDNGTVVWRDELSHGYDEHSALPLVQGDQFLISGPFKAGASMYRVTLDDNVTDKARARVLWSTPKFSNDTASSVLWDGAIYGFDLRDPQAKAHRPSRGEYRCLDWDTGTILWSDTTIGHATTLVADGKLWMFNDRGEIIVAHADRTAYREIGRAMVFPDEICWTAPALAEGRLFLRSMTHAVCLDVRDPSAHATSEAAKPVGVPLEQMPQATPAWKWEWLINGEREHPFMRPAVDELGWWYGWGIATMVPALLIGGVATFAWPSFKIVTMWCVMFLMLLLSAIATPLLNLRTDHFVLTWPATLFASFLSVLILGHTLRGRSLSWTEHLLARLGMLCFLGVCLLYFLLLRRFSLPHEWVFLAGFLPMWWPTSRLAAATLHRGITPSVVGRIALAFSAYFWICGGWHLLQTMRAG